MTFFELRARGQFALLPIQVDGAPLMAYELRVLIAYYVVVVRN